MVICLNALLNGVVAELTKYLALPNLVGSVAPKIGSRDPIIISRDEAL